MVFVSSFRTKAVLLAVTLACLLAALLGISLSVGAHGGSRLRGFSMAIGVLVLYIVIGHLFVVLGRNGLLPAPGKKSKR